MQRGVDVNYEAKHSHTANQYIAGAIRGPVPEYLEGHTSADPMLIQFTSSNDQRYRPWPPRCNICDGQLKLAILSIVEMRSGGIPLSRNIPRKR